MGGRRHVKITKEDGAIIPYGNDNDTRKDEEEDVIVLAGEDTTYDREKEIKKFKERKSKELVKIPSAQDLYYKRDDMKKAREEIYEKILQNIIIDIKQANRDEKIECKYHLPVGMVNLPTYDFTECTWYIVTRLRNEGNMFVRFWEPNMLYINWRVKIVRKENAMSKKPSPRAKPKSKPKVKGKGKEKKEVNTFNLDSDDDLLSSLAGLRNKT